LLKDEFHNEINTLKKIIKNHSRPLIKTSFKGTIRGMFLKNVSNALYRYLPNYVLVPRSLFSKILFGDNRYIIKVFQGKGNESLFIGEQNCVKMRKNLENLKYNEENIGSLFHERGFSNEELEQFKIEMTEIINHFGDIGRNIYINEEVIGILIRKIFISQIIFDTSIIHHPYQPNWLISNNGYQRDLDWYVELSDGINLAVEVNGPWHKDRQHIDEWKMHKCKLNKVILVVIKLEKINELIGLVNELCNNPKIMKICEVLGLDHHLEVNVRKFYNNPDNFRDIVKEIHRMAKRQMEARQGITHIDNW